MAERARASDLVVVGGGAAGAALALAARQRGLDVVVLERAQGAARRVGETLAAVGSQALRELGVWEDFQTRGHLPAYAQRAFWGSSEPREHSSVFDPFGAGFHLDRSAFDRWLLASARAAGAALIAPARVREVVPARGGASRIRYDAPGGAGELLARCVADATGVSAWLGRRLGATRRTPQRMVGVARWFEPKAIEPITLVEATAQGWWYCAPTPHALAVVWMTDARSPSARTSRSDAGWQRCLADAPNLQRLLRGARALPAIAVSATGPACTSWAPSRAWLPVGDAAIALDPISGEGLCFALRSALEAARAFAAACSGDDSGYERYRGGIERVFAAHLAMRQQVYAIETRFADAPFWQRARIASAELSVPARP